MIVDAWRFTPQENTKRTFSIFMEVYFCRKVCRVLTVDVWLCLNGKLPRTIDSRHS